MTTFVRFGQVGRERYPCDRVGCLNEARWERADGVVRGVPLLYCTPCKRKVEEDEG